MSESEYLKRPDAQGHLKVMEVLRRWDPIGVFKINPNWAQDEYDTYSEEIVRMLDGGVSSDVLAAHLTRIVEERMGIDSNVTRDKEIAKMLVEYWKKWRSS